MSNRHYSEHLVYQKWFVERLAGKNVANIRFHLNDHDIDPVFREEFYGQVARLFKNCFSRKFIRGVRYGASCAPMTIHLHTGDGGHELKGRHLHIVAAYPENRSIEDVKRFVEDFCSKPREIKDTEKYVLLTKGTFYVEDASTVSGSIIYNSRFGNGTLLLSS
jgi:hypothetical protein